MSELFAVFKQHLLWSLLLWLLLFLVFAAAFARGKLGTFAQGLTRLLVAIVISPFVFLRRATAAVVGFDGKQEESFRAGDQYALSKAMMVLQAIVIIAAIGALAAAVVATWNVLVPPGEVRAAAREHRPKLEQQKTDAAAAAAALAKLDAEWATREQAAVAKFRNERQARINTASREMAEVENTVNTYGNDNVKIIFRNLKDRAAGRSTESRQDVNSAKSSLDYHVSDHWYWLEDWSRASLNRWSELWMTKATAELELRNLTLTELRNTEQPDFGYASAKNSIEAGELRSMTETQAHLDEAASLKWRAALIRATAAFVMFLLFVWTAALLIEGGWLAIRVAGDVRRLRESAEGDRRIEPAVDGALLPIRDRAMPSIFAASPGPPADAR